MRKLMNGFLQMPVERRRLNAMKEAAQTRIHDDLMPALAARIAASLPDTDTWELFPASEDENRDRQTLLFRYPTSIPAAQDYVRRLVRIELGARSDSEPVENAEVHPYLCDAFPDVLGPGTFRARALDRSDIFSRAAKHREIYFAWSWMDYSTLRQGSDRPQGQA